MRTKIGELIMRKRNETAQVPLPSKTIPLVESLFQSSVKVESDRKRPFSYVSHINEYNFLVITNKDNKGPSASPDLLREMEIQNFRLIESNMKLEEWTQSLLVGLRQQILRVIYTIEEFRYLEGVEKLHQILSEMNEYEERGFALPRPIRQDSYTADRQDDYDPPSKRYPTFNISRLGVCCNEYSLSIRPIMGQDFSNKQKAKDRHSLRSLNSLNDGCEPDYAQDEVEEGQQHLISLLFMQSLVIEQQILQYSR